MRIQITPKRVEETADMIVKAKNEYQAITNRLQTSIFHLQTAWMGTTQQAFFSDFFQAKRIMHDCVKNLNEVEWELRQIAKKFREADGKSIW